MPIREVVDPSVVRQITNLRNMHKQPVPETGALSPQAVGELLVNLLDEVEQIERQPPFGQVASHLCHYVYDLRDPLTLKRVATTALAAINLRGDLASDVEGRTGLRHGQLAKVKGGAQMAITPLQVIALAHDLELSVETLFTDFANQPEVLRQLLNGSAVPMVPEPTTESPPVVVMTPESKSTEKPTEPTPVMQTPVSVPEVQQVPVEPSTDPVR